MKKILLLLSFLSLFLLLSLTLLPHLALAELPEPDLDSGTGGTGEDTGGGWVGKCATSPTGCSNLEDLKEIPCNIAKFLMKNIAVPASALFLTIGGLLILFSAGDPHLFSLGKRILIITIIGMFLVFGADAIVQMIYPGAKKCLGG
jgi:type IV secretory pathway VirB2 component (pilin)